MNINSEWYIQTEKTIEQLESSEISQQNAILLNSLYGLKKKWDKENKEKEKAERNISPEAEYSSISINPDIDYMHYIEDELESSEDYYNKWLHTKDNDLKNMSMQELSHAEYWIRKARENNILTDAELKDIKIRHGSMLAKLS